MSTDDWAAERRATRAAALALLAKTPPAPCCPNCGGALASSHNADDEGLSSTRLHCLRCTYRARPAPPGRDATRAAIALLRAQHEPAYVELQFKYDTGPFPVDEL